MSPNAHSRHCTGWRLALGGVGNGTVSAWAAAIGFTAVAALSFVLDQMVSLSPTAAASGKVEFEPLRFSGTLSQLNPVPLLESLVEDIGGVTSSDPKD